MKDLTGKKVLIIQTAFIGDVILATSLVETLKKHFSLVEIHFLLRKGNENLLEDNLNIAKVIIWDKSKSKYGSLFRLIPVIRSEKYDVVINMQRFFTTGLITLLSGGSMKVGFKKNPLSLFFSKSKDHQIGDGTHEIDRNNKLLEDFIDQKPLLPRLYTEGVRDGIRKYQSHNYVCMAPSSVWFTKQFPEIKWIELVNLINEQIKIYLLGGPGDKDMCNRIITGSSRKNIENLSGKLSFLESAALIQGAQMNYVNDSAPLHMASAVNAPTTAIFCSTIPEFGFSPLSDNSKVVQISYALSCRPCGIHGKRSCPEGHFKCGLEIDVKSQLSNQFHSGDPHL